MSSDAATDYRARAIEYIARIYKLEIIWICIQKQICIQNESHWSLNILNIINVI